MKVATGLRAGLHELFAADVDAALPRVTVRLGPSWPGWFWRGASAAVSVACVLVMSPSVAGVVLVGLAAVVLVVRPGYVAPGLMSILLGVLALVYRSGFGWPTFVLLFGIHLMVALALIGRAGVEVRVELQALLPTARRFAAVQLSAQLFGVGAATLGAGDFRLAWLTPLAGSVLLGLVVWLLPRLAEPPRL